MDNTTAVTYDNIQDLYANYVFLDPSQSAPGAAATPPLHVAGATSASSASTTAAPAAHPSMTSAPRGESQLKKKKTCFFQKISNFFTTKFEKNILKTQKK